MTTAPEPPAGPSGDPWDAQDDLRDPPERAPAIGPEPVLWIEPPEHLLPLAPCPHGGYPCCPPPGWPGTVAQWEDAVSYLSWLDHIEDWDGLRAATGGRRPLPDYDVLPF